LEQVGEEFDVTRERVRQIEQKVIQKLKEHTGLQKMLGIEDDIEKMEHERLKKKRGRKSKIENKTEITNEFKDDEDDYDAYDDDEERYDE
jgi:hypothetical protein